jgi:hypothetical protein
VTAKDEYLKANGTTDTNQYIKTWVHEDRYSWFDRFRNMSAEDIRIEAICRKGLSYAADGQVFRFQETWFGNNSQEGFYDSCDDPDYRYNKDGNSDLVLVASCSMEFEVHTLILSKAS